MIDGLDPTSAREQLIVLLIVVAVVAFGMAIGFS